MRTKDSSVELKITEPQFVDYLFNVVDDYYREKGDEAIITSGSELESKHSTTSLHYAGRAADIRIWQRANVPAPEQQLNDLILRTRVYLTNRKIPINYIDLVLESTHIHLEWQPKRAS